ncbi:RDD family protein [Nocardioides sp. AE5]|uniref:RDD family protein n=1 Tax=Nocardioides sp. AE5 TaxID=2962573 RepID=UPI0028824E48|nr:RDD family protein [Nocardioides sp. AE5]MDT0201743.1 RDD family protein [Nocardioides sp. AE5]
MQQTASWLQRVFALIIDWVVSMLVVMLIAGADSFTGDQRGSAYTLIVFVVESAVFTALLGGSFGKLAIRLRVVRADGSGRPVDIFRALLRQVMVALVIPPLVFRPDGRGLHDMAAGTVSVNLRDVHPDLAARS